MSLQEECFIDCPYCGEPISVLVDCSCEQQTYVEDCQVCCQPVVCILQVHGDEWMLEVRREDDA